MSTRSKAKSALPPKAPEPVTPSLKSKVRATAQTAHSDDMDVDSISQDGDDKENVKSSVSKTIMGPPSRTRKSISRRAKARVPLRRVDCICSKGDDGSPMILCSRCHIWYHFTCVDISEPEAEEISVYVCPTCTTSTGCRSTMEWEGNQAIEEDTDDESTIVARRNTVFKAHKKTPEEIQNTGESEDESSSEDEYVEEKPSSLKKEESTEKRLARLPRLAMTSDSDSVSDVSKRRPSRTKLSPSPSPVIQGHLKRKVTNVHHPTPPPPNKKKRAREGQADDPVRKYCLAKLEELFKDVFLRYPHVRVAANSGDEPASEEKDGQGHADTKIVSKKLEELTDEEKDALLKESQHFSQDLENCVFEIYSEPDKNGHPHAGGKYKERFRMLQFNLSKVDRVIIHQRITSGTISPREISLMSSTDLADEETKQSIKLAEKEALEHSILLKSTMPRAKITHKGLQDIEDVNGEAVATPHEIEVHREREQEEEERRDRERMARLRTTQRQRTASVSVPPESPTVQQSPTMAGLWGGPPPVPAHAMSPTSADFSGSGSRPPVFMHTSDLNTTELELNLADLINIDDEHDAGSSIYSAPGSNLISSPVDATNSTIHSQTPTGISPFAARPERQRGASFDLDALWKMSKDDAAPNETQPDPTPAADNAPEKTASPTPVDDTQVGGGDKDEAMELESVEANDQDFDMFLEEKDVQEQDQSEELIVTPIPPRTIEHLPEVWTGKLTMPLDSSMPQETTLVARQIAGKHIPADSPLWQTLFPTDLLRIEGRVAVEKSAEYLVGMRLNSQKELYAVALVPKSPEEEQDFKAFCDFLISKGRHGLVFPWGTRYRDNLPGRELYMIPLRQSEPLPEFVELLDDLKLPTVRSRDYLLGIWIINKGKLAVLPPQLPHVPTPPTVAAPPQSHTPVANVTVPPFSTPTAGPSHPVATLPPPSAPPLPPQRSLSTPLPPPLPMLPPSIPGLPIAPSTLAAEVASLTPAQIQEVLRTLQSATSIQLPPMPQTSMPPALPPSMPPSVPPPMHNMHRPPMHHGPSPPLGVQTPPMAPNPPMMNANQPWMPQPVPSYNNYPPPNVPFQQPPAHPPHNNPGMPSHAPMNRPDYDRSEYDRPNDYDRQNYDRDFQHNPNYQQGSGSRGDHRNWRGNNNNRGGNNQRQNSAQRGGRGRGGGEAGGDFNSRRDSGWGSRRPRDGHGGPSWN